ncbi:MAG TPA: hypothetical protein VGX75_01645 [bacterium]|nr:hypothetical protein [bacterium]
MDLHKTNFVVCFLDEQDVPKLETHALTESGLAAFCRRLSPSDHLAVETAQNVYYFNERIRTLVDRVVLVDPYKFAIIAMASQRPCAE